MAAGPEGATSVPAMGKFADSEPSAGPRFVYAFGTLADFQRGLTGLVGPPGEGASVLEAIRTEHCSRADSRTRFTTGNYGITTTSEVEFWFVYDPSAPILATLGLDCWPAETRGGEHPRQPQSLNEFEVERLALSARLAASATGLALSMEAVLAARLCSGAPTKRGIPSPPLQH